MNLATEIKSFVIKSKRVWKVLKKPGMEELSAVAKVSAAGILIIGAIGFAISFFIKGIL